MICICVDYFENDQGTFLNLTPTPSPVLYIPYT